MINVSNSTRIIRPVATATDLSHAAAELIVSLGQQAIAARGCFTIALAGGSTPRRLYALLATEPWRSQLDWSAVEWFFGDERAVAPAHAESNYRMAHEALLGTPGCVSAAHPPHAGRAGGSRGRGGRLPDRTGERVRCQCRCTATRFRPRAAWDMGNDGHTASLFPHTEALSVDEAWVVQQMKCRNSIPAA